MHFIPNGIITAVTNMSREFSYAVMDIGVAYREDIDQVCALMRKVGADLRADDNFALKILEDFEMAGVEKLADAAVVIKCRFKVMSLEQWNVRREYLKRIKRAFDEHNIEYRFAS